MDPALLRDYENYRKRASNAPLVEARKRPAQPESSKSRPHKKAKPEREKPIQREFDYKTATGSSEYKFGILTKIVRYLRSMHQKGVQEAITIEDILDETNQTDIGPRNRHWLISEALPNNSKVEVIDNNTYRFKPEHNIRDKKGLLNLLKDNEQNGNGCILMDVIEESVPNVTKVMKDLKDSVIHLVRPDKKEIVYYNNKDDYPPAAIDEDIMKCWRSVAVDGVDERKFEEYLKKHNITAMENLEIKKATAQKKKPSNRKAKPFKTHNEHMGDILKDYSAK